LPSGHQTVIKESRPGVAETEGDCVRIIRQSPLRGRDCRITLGWLVLGWLVILATWHSNEKPSHTNLTRTTGVILRWKKPPQSGPRWQTRILVKLRKCLRSRDGGARDADTSTGIYSFGSGRSGRSARDEGVSFTPAWLIDTPAARASGSRPATRHRTKLPGCRPAPLATAHRFLDQVASMS